MQVLNMVSIMELVLRKITASILVLMLAACNASPAPVPTPSKEQMDAEEQVIFAVVLEALHAADQYVIMDATATGPGGVTGSADTLELVRQNFRGLESSAIDSFLARNTAAQPVGADLELGSPYNLLSQEQMSAMFSHNRDGWQLFYAQYPDAPGITSFSRAGYNDSFDQALVYAGTLSGYLAGAGYYFLLIKVDGTWLLDQKVMTWIS
jgi:hypothetical protein